MKIFLTGEPHIGRSTLLNRIVSGVEPKLGFVTKELLSKGARTGFILVSSVGDKAVMASVDSSSDVRVSRYGVEIEVLDSFIAKLSPIRSDALLYIDEIGQMELHSDRFKVLVEEYLSATNPFIGTLSSVYGDEFTDRLRARADVEIIEVTTKNRDDLVDVLIERIYDTLVG